MQVAARKAPSSTIISPESDIFDVSQNTTNNSPVSTSPPLPLKTSKVTDISAKNPNTKPVETAKENDLARLLAAYGDCV